MLHDFGGNNFLYGSLINVTNVTLELGFSRILSSRVSLFQGPQEARDLSGDQMIGVGITMEGINQNEIMYEFALEQSWRRPLNETQLNDW